LKSDRGLSSLSCDAFGAAAMENRWIRGAAEKGARQTEDLEKALTVLKNP
jgi:hypothetical protein